MFKLMDKKIIENFLLKKIAVLAQWLLTLLRPMEFSIKFDTVKSGWSIVYIEGYRL